MITEKISNADVEKFYNIKRHFTKMTVDEYYWLLNTLNNSGVVKSEEETYRLARMYPLSNHFKGVKMADIIWLINKLQKQFKSMI